MPTIRTGNQEWDQNLNTLGSALFPDPSKAAHAYYYGSEARKAQIEAAKIQDQMAAGHAQLGTVFGRPANPTFRQGGFDTTIMNDPYAVPAAPGPTAPPAGPGQPVAPVQALPTLATTVAQTPPQAIGHGVVAGVENNAQSATLPPMAPATAVSPPEPTTTASNGTSPRNAPMNVQPGSVTSAGGGGVIMAPPGAADGTPAPATFNMGQAIALGVAAGQTPDQAYAVARGVLGNMVKNGQMALPLAEQIAAFYGAPQMRVQTQTNEGNLAVGAQTQAGATQRTGMEIAGRKDTTGMTIAGENYRAGLPLQDIVDPNDPTKVTKVPLSQLQGLGGRASYNPNAVTAGVAPVTVQPGGPGTAAYSQPAFRAQQPQPGAPGQPPQPGMPTYQAGTEDIRQTQLGAVHNWIDPKQPTVLIPGTVEEARQNGWAAVPTTMEGWTSLAAYASANAPPDQAQQIRQKVLAFATTTTPKPVTAEETNREQMLLDNQLEKHLPVPAGVYVKEPWWTNKQPAGASPALGTVLSDLTDQYFRYDPETRGNQVTSANKAIKQLIEEKRIDPNQGRTTGWISDEKTLNKTVLTKEGPKQVPHFRVDLLDESGKPIKEGAPIPRIQMRRSLGATVAPGPTGPAPRGPAPLVTGRQPAGAAPAPAVPAPAATAAPAAPPAGTVIGPAQGLPEGHTGTINGAGGRAVVRGGNWVVQ